ncbi:LCP family protein [Planotetraspora phitsanulokensis]|uniref:Transcriptional regulator n=1 Tax=Planotetraspora phitsanulokensis TaxID=575192 RepID=A0A8J3U8D6_9ACTN|nr:LCP family protein [Planotetraspora phitsanulokensis]GII37889.1 transcriptional regulator [Planotetraspora phitsanulokensis]
MTSIEDLLDADAVRPPSRRRRVVIIVSLIVLVPIVGIFALLMQRQHVYDNNIERVQQVFPEERERPAKVVGSAQNWLVIGADRRPGDSGFQRSDSLMIVHVPADRRRIFLISIPRDSHVPIPGHGRDKINAAYAYGGPRLLIKTVENLTKVRIDHFAALDFNGFIAMSKALGGVELYIARDSVDTANKVTWKQGTVRLEGEKALLFVRQRYGLPDGDFDRIKRQQAFLQAMAQKAISKGTLTNPFKLDEFLQALTKSITVDSGVSIGTLRDLALELRDIRGTDLVSTTIPVAGTGMVGGASIVRLDDTGVASMTEAVRNDTLDDYFANGGVVNDGSFIR